MDAQREAAGKGDEGEGEEKEGRGARRGGEKATTTQRRRLGPLYNVEDPVKSAEFAESFDSPKSLQNPANVAKPGRHYQGLVDQPTGACARPFSHPYPSLPLASAPNVGHPSVPPVPSAISRPLAPRLRSAGSTRSVGRQDVSLNVSSL